MMMMMITTWSTKRAFSDFSTWDEWWQNYFLILLTNNLKAWDASASKNYSSPSPKFVTSPWGNNWLSHTNHCPLLGPTFVIDRILRTESIRDSVRRINWQSRKSSKSSVCPHSPVVCQEIDSVTIHPKSRNLNRANLLNQLWDHTQNLGRQIFIKKKQF